MLIVYFDSFLLILTCSQLSYPRELHSIPARRSSDLARRPPGAGRPAGPREPSPPRRAPPGGGPGVTRSDRKSTRLNSSHLVISYAVFCLKKKIKINEVPSHVDI